MVAKNIYAFRQAFILSLHISDILSVVCDK